jgi:hypothetical protein
MTAREALLISNIAFMALVALAFVAAVVVFFLNRSSERAKDRQLAAYQAAAEAHTHAARAEAVAAMERAVASESENVRARERTAMLLREAAALHAQALASRATPVASLPPPALAAPETAAPWDGTLSNEQRGRMIAALIRRPGEVTLMSDSGPGAERLSAELRSVFTASGWRVQSGIVVDPKIPLAPLSLVLGATEQDKAVRRAFAAAGVPVADRPRGPLDRATSVYIGS